MVCLLTADLHRKPAVEGHQIRDHQIRDPFLPAVFLLSEIPIFGIQRKKNFALLCSFLAGLPSMEGSLLCIFQWISVSWGLLWINLIVWDVSVLHPILQGRQRHGLGLLSKALFFPIAHLRVYQLPKRKSWKTGLLMPPKETAAA